MPREQMIFFLGAGQRTPDQNMDLCLPVSLTGVMQAPVISSRTQYTALNKIIYPLIWTDEVILMREQTAECQIPDRLMGEFFLPQDYVPAKELNWSFIVYQAFESFS